MPLLVSTPSPTWRSFCSLWLAAVRSADLGWTIFPCWTFSSSLRCMGFNAVDSKGRTFFLLFVIVCTLAFSGTSFGLHYGEGNRALERPGSIVAPQAEKAAHGGTDYFAGVRVRSTEGDTLCATSDCCPERAPLCFSTTGTSSGYSGQYAHSSTMGVHMWQAQQGCLYILRKMWASMVGDDEASSGTELQGRRCHNAMERHHTLVGEYAIPTGPQPDAAWRSSATWQRQGQGEAGGGEGRGQKASSSGSLAHAPQAPCCQGAANASSCGDRELLNGRATAEFSFDGSTDAEGELAAGGPASCGRHCPLQRRTGSQRPSQGGEASSQSKARAGQDWSAEIDGVLGLGGIPTTGDRDGHQTVAGARERAPDPRRGRGIVEAEFGDGCCGLRQIVGSAPRGGGGGGSDFGSNEDMCDPRACQASGAAGAATAIIAIAPGGIQDCSIDGECCPAGHIPHDKATETRTGGYILSRADVGCQSYRGGRGKAGCLLARALRTAGFYLGLGGCLDEHLRPWRLEEGIWTCSSHTVCSQPDYVSELRAKVLGLQLEMSVGLDTAGFLVAESWYDPRMHDDWKQQHGDVPVFPVVQRATELTCAVQTVHSVDRECANGRSSRCLRHVPVRRGNAVHSVTFDFSVEFWFPAPNQITLNRNRRPQFKGGSCRSFTEGSPHRSCHTSSMKVVSGAASAWNGFGPSRHNDSISAAPSRREVEPNPSCQVHGMTFRSEADRFLSRRPLPLAAPPMSGVEHNIFCREPLVDAIDLIFPFEAHCQEQEHLNCLAAGIAATAIEDDRSCAASQVTWPTAPRSKAQSKRHRSPEVRPVGVAPYVPPSRGVRFNAQARMAAFDVFAATGSTAISSLPDHFTGFDVLSQAVVHRRDPTWDPLTCLQEAVWRSLIPNPMGRIMLTQVESYPGPQIMVSSWGRFRTHRGVVLICRSCVPPMRVCEFQLGATLRSFLFGMTVDRSHPWSEALYQMLSYTCVVDGRPFDCSQILPADADVIEVFARPPVLEEDVRTLQDTLPITGLPNIAHSRMSVSAVEHAPSYVADVTRPPVPPILPDAGRPGRRWGTMSNHAATQGISATPACATTVFSSAGERFVLFDEFLHMRQLHVPSGAQAHDLVQIAYDQTVQLAYPRGHRFLHHAIPGLPAIQLCIWGGLGIDEVVLPFLTQDAHRPVCTVRVPRESSAFEAALNIEAACGFGPFLHQGLQHRQIHMAVNGRPIQPHTRWALGRADYAGFSVGPVPGHMAPQPATRWAPEAPSAIPVVSAEAVTDGEPTGEIMAHRPGHVPLLLDFPAHFNPRRGASFASWLIGDGHQYSLHLPQVMPLCQGTPLHCFLMSASHPRRVNVAILDLRRVLCPPTAPFITVEIAPIVNFPSVVHGLGSVAPRHRPVTAAYLNDELMGACSSVCGPVCVITLLSHEQTRGPAGRDGVCLLDAVEAACTRPGFRMHLRGRGPLAARTEQGPTSLGSTMPGLRAEVLPEGAAQNGSLRTSTSTTTTCPGYHDLPPARPPFSGAPGWDSEASRSRSRQSSVGTVGPPMVFNPFRPPQPLLNPVHPAARQCHAHQRDEPPPGQRFTPWSVWDEATDEGRNRHRPGEGTPPASNTEPVARTRATTAAFAGIEVPPPGQSFSPWSVWDDDDSPGPEGSGVRDWGLGAAHAPGSETTAFPWDTCIPEDVPYDGNCPTDNPTSGQGTHSGAIHTMNPALPAGWPTEQSFLEHCNVLATLDPRVCPNSFTLFDVALQVRLIPKTRGADESAVRAIAQAHCRHLTPPVHLHILRDTLPGFPTPQVVASAGELPRQAFAIPLDLRPSGWGVCVVPARIGASAFTVAHDATTICPVRQFAQKIARQTLLMSSRGRDIDRFQPVPVDVDYIRVRRSSEFSGVNTGQPSAPQADREQDEAILGHIDDDGFFNVAVHAPACPSVTLRMHKHDSPHDVIRRASRQYLAMRPHTTVQGCWPIESPRGPDHLLHLLLDFDRCRTEERTMFLVDCRGVRREGQDFAVFVACKELTAGELYAALQANAPCEEPPAYVLVNNRPLRDLGPYRYHCPLIRLLTRMQFEAYVVDRDLFCPATFSTADILRHVPSFSALSDTFEAFLQRQYGVRRGVPGGSGEGDATTTTTTETGANPASAVFDVFTTTTSTEAAHPYDPLTHLPIRFHLFSHGGDILTSRVVAEDQMEVLLHKFCRSLVTHRRYRPHEEVAAHHRVHFCARSVDVFLYTRQLQSARRCWLFAPQWNADPALIRCHEGVDRQEVLSRLGVPDRPEVILILDGVERRQLIFPRQGDVVLVASSHFALHSAPLAALLHRLPDIQVLLFRQECPVPAVVEDERMHRTFWRSAVQRCQTLLGLHRPGVRATLVSETMPCMTVCLGTLVYPTAMQIQVFYDRFLADKFGKRTFRDVAFMDRDVALFCERCRRQGRKLWIVTIPTGVDTSVADPQGDEIRDFHLGGGWFLQPATSCSGYGMACITRRTQVGAVAQYVADDSDGIEFVVPEPGSGSLHVTDSMRELAADVRRIRDDGLTVSAPATPPEAFAGRPPPPLTQAQVATETHARDAVVRFEDFGTEFPIFARLLQAVPSPNEAPCEEDERPQPMSVSSASTSEVGNGSADDEDTGGPESATEASSFIQLHAAKIRQTAGRAVGETTPQVVTVRNVATPCRAGARKPVTPSLSKARDPITTDACAPARRVTLCLDILLSYTGAKIQAATLQTQVTLEQLLGLASLFRPASFRTDFALPERHPATTAAMRDVDTWSLQDRPEELHLYTDGSFFADTGKAGWAVVAMAYHGQKWHWGGYMSGQLYPAGHQKHCGQTVVNPHTAELVALAHAAIVAVQAQGACVTIHYDAESAAAVAAGTAASHGQHTLMSALHGMRYLADNLCTLRFEHVSAHQGHPWNEAADTAAKAAAKYGLEHCPGSTEFATAVRTRVFDWSWWTVSPHCAQAVLPGLDDIGNSLPSEGFHTCRHCLDTIPGIPRAITEAQNQGQSRAKWKLQIVSYNCTTLTKECDRQCLAKGFGDSGIHLIGMQESRMDCGPKRVQHPYVCFCSAAVQGNFGCQLWIHTALSPAFTCTGDSVSFDVGRATILVQEPRILVVLLPAGSLLFACVVAHSPVAETGPAEAAAWWQHFDSAFRRIPRRAIPVLFVDANARFVPTEEAHSASNGIPKGDNARAWQDFVQEHP